MFVDLKRVAGRAPGVATVYVPMEPGPQCRTISRQAEGVYGWVVSIGIAELIARSVLAGSICRSLLRR